MTSRRRGPVATLFAALAAASLLAVPPRPEPIRGLTRGEDLARAYARAFDADFTGAASELTRACGPAPREACDVLGVAVLWWELYLDADSRRLDQTFVARAEQAIAGAEAWTVREPDRAEAWFYLGAAYGARVQLKAQRREYFSAARDGKRIIGSLERALALDPGLHDANFGSGLYKYYADIAPSILKFVRWLLALPGGDKTEGLRLMLRTREQGILLRDDANYQLHQIDLWYEKRPDRALNLLQELRQRHPRNPLFLADIARVHGVYRSDRRASLDAYRELIELGRTGRVNQAHLAVTWGRLGAAAQLQALGDTDRAAADLQAVIDARPSAPYGSLAAAHLALGRLQQRLGRRDLAAASYRSAVDAAPPDDPNDVRKQARDALSRLR